MALRRFSSSPLDSPSAVVCVLGGTGFLGRQVTRILAQCPSVAQVRVLSRHATAAATATATTGSGKVRWVQCDGKDVQGMRQAMQGATSVVSLVGILYPTRSQSFCDAHVTTAVNAATVCRDLGIPSLVHVSAIGADSASPSMYASTKGLAEEKVAELFPPRSVLRPSIIFGPEDNFFNQFATMAKFSPVLPLIGGGTTRFQPVFVGDVASAVLHCILYPDSTRGQLYELGGPDIMTFEEILRFILRTTGRKRLLVPIPFPLATLQGTVLEKFPRPLLTADQVTLLKSDNVVSSGALTLADMEIVASSVADIVPTYLS